MLATGLAFFASGYHPYCEDGGTYAVSVEWLLDRRLFPWTTDFVADHVRWSLFSYGAAAIARCTHLSVDAVLLLLYLGTSALMLAAGWFLLRKLGFGSSTAWAGVILLACLWTLPVAGTSLMLVDPYTTARSLSTPLSLMALAWAVQDWRQPRARAPVFCAGALLLTAAFHPMMAVYTLGQVAMIRVWMYRRRWALLLIFASVVLAGAWGLQSLMPSDSPAVRVASITRYFWYLKEWQWYEWLGLIGPLVVMHAAAWKLPRQNRAGLLVRAMTAYAGVAVVCSLIYCHEGSRTDILARLQPLRVYLLIYAVLPLLLGAALRERLQKRWGVAVLGCVFAVSCAGMFAAQRSIYTYSPHIETQWTKRPNQWAAAFLWARHNTPVDALFALDADYINAHGEDAHAFRAIALRNALADRAKDGGEVAAMRPELAGKWIAELALTTGLDRMNDADRDARLLPHGVSWVVLTRAAATQHPCPYQNDLVKVCRLR